VVAEAMGGSRTGAARGPSRPRCESELPQGDLDGSRRLGALVPPGECEQGQGPTPGPAAVFPSLPTSAVVADGRGAGSEAMSPSTVLSPTPRVS